MSDFSTKAERLFHLADVVWDGYASEGDLAELDDILAANESLQFDYLEYCRMHAVLDLDLQAQRAVRKSQEQIGFGRTTPCDTVSLLSVSEADSGLSSPAFQGSVGLVSSGWLMAYLVATVLLGVGILVGSLIQVSQPTQIANHANSDVEQRFTVATEEEIVGRITGMVDCVWEGTEFRVQGSGTGGQHSDLPSPGHRPEGLVGGRGARGESSLHLHSLIRFNDRLALRSGLLEITYDTGAKVILQGPMTYQVDSAAGGYLSVWQADGAVGEEGGRSESPLARSRERGRG